MDREYTSMENSSSSSSAAHKFQAKKNPNPNDKFIAESLLAANLL